MNSKLSDDRRDGVVPNLCNVDSVNSLVKRQRLGSHRLFTLQTSPRKNKPHIYRRTSPSQKRKN